MNEITRSEREIRTFLRDIENDNIDKSQWIKRSDADKLIEAQKQRTEGINTIADILVIRGFLEPEAIDYGFTLMELRNAFLGKLNAKSAAYSMLQSFFGGVEPRTHAERMYDDIIREITLSGQRIIESALFDLWPATGMPSEASVVYRIQFDRLMTATEGAARKIKKDIELGVA
jgi:hypothetical protein